MPDNRQNRKGQPKATSFNGYRGASAVHQMGPQRTFSPTRFRQPAFSNPRFRESTFRTARMQPRMNSSFANRPAMTSTVARRQTRAAFTNDWAGSRFSARPRPSSAFINRTEIGDLGNRRQSRPLPNDFREARLSDRARTSSSLLKRFTMNDAAARRQTRAEFNDRWANSYFRGQTRNSFVNRSAATSPAIQEQRRAAFSNNWRGDWFAGRQYSAFRNYQSQWHDSGWWHDHCGDRIVFVTVYSQRFPFFFDAGYWYPCWGYYPDAYYPYDGPIYGYNDLSPDEIITNVQIQLYNEGYYSGPIDGILGPDTRAAIADYQADHGLAVTAAIDEPTVASLGLV